MPNKFYLVLGIIGSLSLTACSSGADSLTETTPKPPAETPSEPSTPPVTPNEPDNGGDNNNGNGGNTEPPVTEPNEPPAPEPGNSFPEPTSNKYDPARNELGFYDWDRNGDARVFKNHLTGSFAATLQFGQSITTAPNGNEALWHPRPVAEREALLIVIPTAEMGEVNSLTLVASINGVAKAAVQLNRPAEQPQPDRTLKDSRPDVVFSNCAWTTVLPWDWMVPGLELSITDNQNRSGLLAASDLDFAAPGQLVVNQIQLGMLTGYPGKGYMLNSPEAAATDYFHTIPAATFLLGEYDPIQLDIVMIDSGKIYTAPQTSDTTGDVYSGDMRENVGKATFSTGINLANWGITSARLGSQEQPQLTQRAVLTVTILT